VSKPTLKPGQLAVVFEDPVKRSGPCSVVWLNHCHGFFRYDENRNLEAWETFTDSSDAGTKGVIRLINPFDGIEKDDETDEK
jgi:hypothetical protein